MDQFFTDADPSEPQITQSQPAQPFLFNNETQPAYGFTQQQPQPNTFEFAVQPDSQSQPAFTYPTSAQNDFNDFEQDETTKRIREQEQRVQNLLRQKSQREWNDKNERQAQGRSQLAQFQARKEQEKQARVQENLQKEEGLRQEYNKLKGKEGWHKVVTSVNLRQGEYKGKKDVSRMREAILHRYEDQSGR